MEEGRGVAVVVVDVLTLTRIIKSVVTAVTTARGGCSGHYVTRNLAGLVMPGSSFRRRNNMGLLYT